MPQPIQAGTVADRLRNFLNLTGRIPVQMDENVVPVANVQSLGEPPWRTEDVDCFAYASSPAVAARFGMVAFRMPAGATGALVIRRVVIASGATTHGASLAIWSNVENEATIANYTVVDRAIDAERIDLTPTSNFLRC